jgi:putative methyltransferase (TIGR04325 family)
VLGKKLRQFWKNALLPNRKQGGIRFQGDYKNWSEARNESTGYDSPQILEKTRDALLKVKSGQAAFERDSVVFDKPDYSFPVLAALLRAAAMDAGHLSVLDFGGSLGSSYFQCRPFFSSLSDLKWYVIEQPDHVACGRQWFESDELHFYSSIAQCLSANPRLNVLLLSGVLPYLEEPYAQLESMLSLRVKTVIVDRTAFISDERDKLTVQSVPGRIYQATYPFWFFSEPRFLDAFATKGYRLLATFTPVDAALLEGSSAWFQGFIFVRD